MNRLDRDVRLDEGVGGRGLGRSERAKSKTPPSWPRRIGSAKSTTMSPMPDADLSVRAGRCADACQSVEVDLLESEVHAGQAVTLVRI
jgi:hypothetical protein